LALGGCAERPPDKDRWNQIFSSQQPVFNTNANAFLAEVVKNRQPGQALDLGMGQGRNALFLAQRGWDVTGVDISDVALAQAREQARKMSLKLNIVQQDAAAFDFGRERWDLVALLYFPPRPYTGRIFQALRPGGLVVVEVFHRESAEKRRLGEGVVFGSNELLRLFEDYRILRYEDVVAPSDWSVERVPTRLLRLVAQKS
jgi:SAM-dependent methyltransferase